MGDKTRMAGLANNESAFVRPSPSKGHLGGVARYTYETISLCECKQSCLLTLVIVIFSGWIRCGAGGNCGSWSVGIDGGGFD